ncbi:hypothetical protein C2845_PM01G37100 [Panicum miliaceum]|uniref:DUF4283 domain-containing protein n=1 Tax=Panicum miliaceum TaxID=4540 RepID=A0A3L6TR34_PANMI|nr:hypothetical protein C2845_PM01G37100 [Panicum miliaceum]
MGEQSRGDAAVPIERDNRRHPDERAEAIRRRDEWRRVNIPWPSPSRVFAEVRRESKEARSEGPKRDDQREFFLNQKGRSALLKLVERSPRFSAAPIISGLATTSKIEEELRHLVDDKWDWRVKQVDSDNFLAVFPNKMILNTFSRSRSIELALNKISAKVTKSDDDHEVSRKLQTGWVRMFGIPSMAKTEEVVKLLAELAGEVVCVDELSLIKEGPVRVKINAREVSKIRGVVEVFFEKDGYDIKFVPEEPSGKPAPKDFPPKKPDVSDEEEEDSNRDTELE